METPKQRFLLSGPANSFKAIAESQVLRTACDYALLQLQSEMRPTAFPGTPVDPYVAIDANSQMWGAARVIDILLRLHEADKPKTPATEKQLHY